MSFKFSFVGVCLTTDIFICFTPKRVYNASKSIKNQLCEYYTKRDGIMYKEYMSIYQILSTFKVNEIIIYLRKSRSENGESVEEVLARHEKMLQDYAMRIFGEEIPEENIYREVVSGETIADRVEIQNVFERINDRYENIKGVLCIEAQRLSRGDMEDCGFLMKNFKLSNTLIITPSKTYDLTDMNDYKILKMELIQGNEYLEYNKTIMERGRELSINEGKWIYAEAPFGYDRYKLKNRKGFSLTPNKDAEYVKMIFDMFVNQNAGTQEIARKLNELGVPTPKNKEWTFKGVKEVLKRETYYGMITRNKRKNKEYLLDGKVIKSKVKNEDYTLVKGLQEPIITKELFEQAQLKLKDNSTPRTPSEYETKNPLASLVKCEMCGKTLQRATAGKKRRRKPVRKYKLNNEELGAFLLTHKNKTRLSIRILAEKIGVHEETLGRWINGYGNKYNHSELLAEKWDEVKTALNIKSNIWDEIVTTYVEPPLHESLTCKNLTCKNVASTLSTIEDAVINKLKHELETFTYFVDNYEQETKKMILNNKKQLKRIDTKIEKLQLALTKARRNYNAEEITKEEYMEDKKYYEEQLDDLFKEREEFESQETKEVVIQYKKAIPILKNCIENYYLLDDIESKNKLLKSLISHIEYKKVKLSARDFDLSLKVYLKI